ncbi:MAG: transcriptional repressor LexA [Arcanobacterium sp.]|nr:transcriptional repressor LexA [Arcanobacterium sp.]
MNLTDRQLRILGTIREGISERGFPPTVREIAAIVGLSSPSSVQYQLGLLEKAGLIQRDSHRSRTIEVTDRGNRLNLETGRLAPEAPAFSGPGASPAPLSTVPLAHDLVPPAPAPATSPAPTSSTATASSQSAQPRVNSALTTRPLHAVTSEMEHTEGSISHRDAELTARDVVIAPLVGTIAAGSPILAEQHIEESFSLPRQLTGSGEMFVLHVKGESMIEAAICDGDYVVVRQQPVAEQGEIVAAMIDGEATVKVLNKKDGHVWLMPCNAAYDPIPADEAQILGRVVSVLRAL